MCTLNIHRINSIRVEQVLELSSCTTDGVKTTYAATIYINFGDNEPFSITLYHDSKHYLEGLRFDPRHAELAPNPVNNQFNDSFGANLDI